MASAGCQINVEAHPTLGGGVGVFSCPTAQLCFTPRQLAPLRLELRRLFGERCPPRLLVAVTRCKSMKARRCDLRISMHMSLQAAQCGKLLPMHRPNPAAARAIGQTLVDMRVMHVLRRASS